MQEFTVLNFKTEYPKSFNTTLNFKAFWITSAYQFIGENNSHC